MKNARLITLSDRDSLDISYSKAKSIDGFYDRLNYLALWKYGYVSPRGMGQWFYKDPRWIAFREEIIARDLGFDLACNGVNIYGRVIVHHIKPILEEDLITWNESILLNPDNVITVSDDTHNKIHYKFIENNNVVLERYPNDTKLW